MRPVILCFYFFLFKINTTYLPLFSVWVFFFLVVIYV